jgi:DNA-binding CsgD family transcriptional regulator
VSGLANEEEGMLRRAIPSKRVLILSPREKKFLRQLAKGKTDEEIAVEIGGSEQQIGEQRRRLIERLRIQSQAQLVAAADQLAAWPAGSRSVKPANERR